MRFEAQDDDDVFCLVIIALSLAVLLGVVSYNVRMAVHDARELPKEESVIKETVKQERTVEHL